MERFYVDSNVWLDLAFDRKNHIRPLGELAFQFFKKCRENNWVILYSELVLKELKKKLTQKEIEEKCFMVVLKREILIKAQHSSKQLLEAKEISGGRGVPLADAIHAVIARDEKAAIVSRDSHFQLLSDIVTCFLPEEI